MNRTNWTRDQLLVCFNLYCRTPFGKLHRNNPEVIRLADEIGRTSSAVAMKLVNFASFDPVHQQRHVKGLANASRQDRQIWDEFNQNPNKLAAQSEEASTRIVGPITRPEEELQIPSGPTEKHLSQPMRLVQDFFRRCVLASYRSSCAFCGLNIRGLMCASHIIPWSVEVKLRADPRNGFCLCALHDRAFDRSLIAVDPDYRLVLSPSLKVKTQAPLHKAAFLDLEGKKMNLPDKFMPYQTSLKYRLTRLQT
jgi:predicted restriction endonuclease